VLRATSELLHGVGLQAMTTDEIAGRSGVSEATIYKWWPNKYAVAVEAVLSAMMAESSDPDTGAARRGAEDLRSMLRGANPIRLCARNCGIISWPLGAKCYGRSGTAA
jgi:AcrR family transcriptional regulator